MKRFLMLVGVAVVAAAMYVAAGSASQQSRGPTMKQFKALKKQVATLNKTLKAVKSEADAALGIIGTCYLHQNTDGTVGFTAMPVSQFGSTSVGFLYGTSTAASSTRSALDIATSSPQAYLQQVDPQCATVNGLRRTAVRSGASRLRRWAGTR
jgi:outer membrane murein-binding lipoprotein Lpp